MLQTWRNRCDSIESIAVLVLKPGHTLTSNWKLNILEYSKHSNCVLFCFFGTSYCIVRNNTLDRDDIIMKRNIVCFLLIQAISIHLLSKLFIWYGNETISITMQYLTIWYINKGKKNKKRMHHLLCTYLLSKLDKEITVV